MKTNSLIALALSALFSASSFAAYEFHVPVKGLAPTEVPTVCVTPWGSTIANHTAVTAYASLSVPYGGTCVSEQRQCTNGVLSGTYSAGSCVVLPSQECATPWGTTVANGDSVTAFASATVPMGETCASETRQCANKVLSGSYTFGSCTVSTTGIQSVSGVKFWADGTYATSCQAYRTGDSQHSYAGATGDGVYRLTVNGSPMDAYCDMTTDNGGWTLILNYLHKGGTNPALSARTTLPLANPAATLGTDESLVSTNWGHATPALVAALPGSTVRHQCRSSMHSRMVHFKTTDPFTLAYYRTGTGNTSGIVTTATNLAGSNSYLPAAVNSLYSNRGTSAMTEFTFYASGAYHWGIKGSGSRWECDDFAGNASYSTSHQIWLR